MRWCVVVSFLTLNRYVKIEWTNISAFHFHALIGCSVAGATCPHIGPY